jgi:hypothetical protein
MFVLKWNFWLSTASFTTERSMFSLTWLIGICIVSSRLKIVRESNTRNTDNAAFSKSEL